MKQIPRELTVAERRDIRRLVVGLCANYDSEYGCLPLDYGRCYMLDKWWTGSLCRYFESSTSLLIQCWNGRSKDSHQPIQSLAPFAGSVSLRRGVKPTAPINAGR